MAYKMAEDDDTMTVSLEELAYDKIVEDMANIDIDEINVDDISVDADNNVEVIVTVTREVVVNIDFDEVADAAEAESGGEDIAISMVEESADADSYAVDVLYRTLELA